MSGKEMNVQVVDIPSSAGPEFLLQILKNG
jgi:hypothetical protein